MEKTESGLKWNYPKQWSSDERVRQAKSTFACPPALPSKKSDDVDGDDGGAVDEAKCRQTS